MEDDWDSEDDQPTTGEAGVARRSLNMKLWGARRGLHITRICTSQSLLLSERLSKTTETLTRSFNSRGAEEDRAAQETRRQLSLQARLSAAASTSPLSSYPRGCSLDYNVDQALTRKQIMQLLDSLYKDHPTRIFNVRGVMTMYFSFDSIVHDFTPRSSVLNKQVIISRG